MHLSRLFSSTKESGQISANNSCFVSKCPLFWTRTQRVWNAFSGRRSSIGPSVRVKVCSRRSSRNGPNSYNSLACSDIEAFETEKENQKKLLGESTIGTPALDIAQERPRSGGTRFRRFDAVDEIGIPGIVAQRAERRFILKQ